MESRYQDFKKEVSGFIPSGRIYTDRLRRFTWGTDAGFYRMTPQIVIITENEDEVSRILKSATRHSLPVTFRAAGTSLSGQSISDSVLVVAGKNWDKWTISSDAASIHGQRSLAGYSLWRCNSQTRLRD